MTGERPSAIVSRPDDYLVEEMPWGRLIWRVSAERGNSTSMTVGECIIFPGQQNGRHVHPNCDEVLYVASGHIVHSADQERTEMTAGDIISIPSGVVHNARNIGDQDAHLYIAFSSAYRQSEGAE